MIKSHIDVIDLNDDKKCFDLCQFIKEISYLATFFRILAVVDQDQDQDKTAFFPHTSRGVKNLTFLQLAGEHPSYTVSQDFG